jgi:hypothetical protein
MLFCFVKQNETKIGYMVLAFKKQPISPAVLKNQQYLQLS